MKKLILKPPSYDDLLRILSAWRVWIVGAVLGAAVASALYLIVPPAYRAQATVLVDQHVEQVIPQEQTDLRKFNYLQRETDKLLVIAWNDQTLSRVTAQTGLPVSKLRDGRLILNQPGDGGWHFLADAADPASAARLASAWASAFVDEVQSKPAGISTFLQVNFAQQKDLPVMRTVSMGFYVFCGALLGITLLALSLLFFDWKNA
jgi:capsular polysaccharide biosynthesis protein